MSEPLYLSDELFNKLVDQSVVDASREHPVDPRGHVIEALGRENVWPASIRGDCEEPATSA